MPTPLPQAFVQRMERLLGADEAKRLCEALDAPCPTSIRVNQRRPIPRVLIPRDAPIVPWCPWGRYLPSRPIFTGDPALHAGGYYVQEASSMLLYQIGSLLSDRPLSALDLCAAPGGKTTLLLDLLPPGSTLVSNEYVQHRANILCENVQKWGAPNAIVTNTAPAQLGRLRHAFDLVVVDAPCSGEGMFRKDDGARAEWSLSAPQMCAERQRSILADIWQALRPGGMLVYSTCTFAPEENEQILTYIIEELGAEGIELPALPDGVLRSQLTTYPAYRMMPHRVEGEGLFLAVVIKADEEARSSRRLGKSTARGVRAPQIPREVHDWLESPDLYLWEQTPSGGIVALPHSLHPLVSELRELRVPILSAGVPIGEVKGRSVIPHPALAYSLALSEGAFDRVELPSAEIIPYLSRTALTLSPDLSPGIKLLTHEGVPLGFAKHIGNRTNNLYPSEWRIRHGERLHQP